jgi:hypothetical protein
MLGLTMLTTWGMSPAWAQAPQSYIQENVPEKLRDVESLDYRRAQGQARDIQRGAKPYDAANKNYLRQWFDAVVFNGMTQLNSMDQLQSQRAMIEFSLSPMGTRPDEVRRDLETLTIAKMKKFVAGNYHPAVRVNACLLLGNLNQVEPQRAPPVPRPDMLPELIAIFNDAKQIDAVRSAALVGIARHVDLRTRFPAMGQVPADQSTAIRGALVKLINQAEAPEGRTQAGHDWLRESAVKIVAQLGKTTADNAAVSALLGVLVEPQASLDLKCTTVESLGQMQLAGVSDVKQVVPRVAGVAAACYAEEMKLIRDVLGDEVTGEAAGGGVLGFGSGTDPGAEIADPATIPTRRRLADRIHRLRIGLASDNPKSTILELATTNQRADVVKQVTDILDETMLALTQTTTTLADVRLELAKQLTRLNTIAPQPAAAAAEPPATETPPAAGTPDAAEPPAGTPPATDTPDLPF